jgi:ABC-type nickel/cobalt efflux system permease component RcnA
MVRFVKLHGSIRFVTFLMTIFVGFLLISPQPAAAHPLGNFSINRYSRLEVTADHLYIFYVLDMAEIPTFQEWARLDVDGDEMISEAEKVAYLAQQVAVLQGNLDLQVNGWPFSLTPQNPNLTFPPGQGDLPTLRLEITFATPLSGDSWSVRYEDHNYADRVGWREIVLQTADSLTLLESTIPTEDMSQALHQYPQDLLQSPLAVSQAEFRVATAIPGQGRVVNETAGAEMAVASSNRFSSDRFVELITVDNPGPGLLAAILLVAFALGAAHALTPGHGKTIVGAYLVGSRGTARHALFLGLTTTVTHTTGVFAFGLLVLFASEFIVSEQLYPWLGVLSGLLIVAIGSSLLRGRWREWYHKPAEDHAQIEGYHTHFGIGHTHTPPAGNNVSWRNLLALGVSGGLLPCPSALVLLLSAIALQKVAFGLLLIVVFSLGLASVLTGIGLALVFAGRFLVNVGMGNGRFAKSVPIFSAFFITVTGVGITIQALGQIGVW